MKSQRNKSQRSQFLVYTCKNLLENIYLTSAKKGFTGSYIYQNVNSIQEVLYAGIFCVLS